MDWTEPFKVYRITKDQASDPEHKADYREEFYGEINDIFLVNGFIGEMLKKEPPGQSRWRVRDAEGRLVSDHGDHMIKPDGQFDIHGCKGERLTVKFSGWDVFNYWWNSVDIEVISGSFCGKGGDYYLSLTPLRNLARQTTNIIEGKSNSYNDVFACGALCFSIIQHDTGVIEIAGVLRDRPNVGRQRVEFTFNSTPDLLTATASQLRDFLHFFYDFGNS